METDRLSSEFKVKRGNLNSRAASPWLTLYLNIYGIISEYLDLN